MKMAVALMLGAAAIACAQTDMVWPLVIVDLLLFGLIASQWR